MSINVDKARIQSIDMLRGFALLGLLSMNIISFSMPNIAYYNPSLVMADSPTNMPIFGFMYVMADQKFMGIFSLLFGASTLLILQRSKGAAKLHFTRNIWLILFGLFHGILFWEGDVLLIYGLCALVLYFLKNFKPASLFFLGLFLFLAPVDFNLFMGWLVPYLDQTSVLWLQNYWAPQLFVLNQDIQLFQGDYVSQLMYRLEGNELNHISNDGYELHGLGQLIDFFGRSIGMMLIGMAAFKTGIIDGQKTASFYLKMSFWGFAIGIPLSVWGLVMLQQHNFEATYSLFLGRIPNHIATLFIVAGYVGVVTWCCHVEKFPRLQTSLSAVGKMALTNYIGQTVIAGFVFYGFGLGLDGQMDRFELLCIMFAIWAIQIVGSVIWLKYFIYGPVEWLWRSLSYVKMAKIKR
jgi:uncharacterized protein